MATGFAHSKLTSGIQTAEADLAADVALNNTANFFDGPSVSLGPGLWSIVASVCVLDGAAAAGFVAKLWDGTTVESQGQAHTAGASSTAQIALGGLVVVLATATWKVSVRDSTSTNGLLKSAPTVGGTGNVASHIRAARLL
jgi:hypothetical protein